MPAKSEKQRRYFGYLYGKIKSGDTESLSKKDKEVIDDMGVEMIRHYVKKEAKMNNYSTYVKMGYQLTKMADLAGKDEGNSLSVMKSISNPDDECVSEMGAMPPLPPDVAKYSPRDVRRIIQYISASQKKPETDEISTNNT